MLAIVLRFPVFQPAFGDTDIVATTPGIPRRKIGKLGGKRSWLAKYVIFTSYRWSFEEVRPPRPLSRLSQAGDPHATARL